MKRCVAAGILFFDEVVAADMKCRPSCSMVDRECRERRPRRRLQVVRGHNQFSAHKLMAIHATHRHAHVGERGGVKILVLGGLH